MTCEEVKKLLLKGKKLYEIFDLTEGQECEIYKAERFAPGEDIIYIPDIYLNDLLREVTDTTGGETKESIANEIVANLYSGDDFLFLADGRKTLAEVLFDYVDWQHPSSVLDNYELNDEEVIHKIFGKRGLVLKKHFVLETLKDYSFEWGREDTEPMIKVFLGPTLIGEFTALGLVKFAEEKASSADIVQGEVGCPKVKLIIRDGIIENVLSDSENIDIEIIDMDRNFDNFNYLSEYTDMFCYNDKELSPVPYSHLSPRNEEPAEE